MVSALPDNPHKRLRTDRGGNLRHSRSFAGFTLIEVVLATAIASSLLVALGAVMTSALAINDDSRERNELTNDARFAMQRMVRHVKATRLLLVPMIENPSTANLESVRDPGVLAVTLDPTLDRDLDGFADADNDRDGRIDEDLPADATNDGQPGLVDIDDNNDGVTDLSPGGSGDDDEDGVASEDPYNGLNDDGDAAIDEDSPADMNDDGQPGIALVDDDGDGFIDEGLASDDDEDGASDEDWLDAVVYYLSGSQLIERFPNLGAADGRGYTQRTIADNVSAFRVTRLPRGMNRAELVEIELELDAELANVTLLERVRVGGAP